MARPVKSAPAQTAVPWNLGDLLKWGAVFLSFQYVLGVLLSTFLPSIASMMICFFLGIPIGAIMCRGVQGLFFPGAAIAAFTGVFPGTIIDVPLFGRVAELPVVGAAPSGPFVAAYTTNGWQIATQHTYVTPLGQSRRSKRYGDRHIAPLVRPGWSPSEPIEYWVMAETRDSGRRTLWHPDDWAHNGGEFVRVTGNEKEGAKNTALFASEKFSLKSVAEPEVLFRTESAQDAIIAQYGLLGWMYVTLLAAWAIVVLAFRELARLWRRAKTLVQKRK